MEKESGNLLKYSVLPTCNVAAGHTLKSNQRTAFDDSFSVMIFPEWSTILLTTAYF